MQPVVIKCGAIEVAAHDSDQGAVTFRDKDGHEFMIAVSLTDARKIGAHLYADNLRITITLDEPTE